MFRDAFHATDQLRERLAHAPAVLVRVAATQGSAPREAGAWMAVWPDSLLGTIGGGHLEHQAIAQAKALLADPGLAANPMNLALGPALGQCCGGRVQLDLQRISAADLPQLTQQLQAPAPAVALFGGGHVGHALIGVLLGLPFGLTWIDSRDGVFPADVPERVHCEQSEPVHGAVRSLAGGSMVLIMSFSHAEDLDIVAACLLRQRERGDLRFIGLIGSQTKWATFKRRLQERGFSQDELAQVTCPIGVPGIAGKEPNVIAVAVAAQLLQLTATT